MESLQAFSSRLFASTNISAKYSGIIVVTEYAYQLFCDKVLNGTDSSSTVSYTQAIVCSLGEVIVPGLCGSVRFISPVSLIQGIHSGLVCFLPPGKLVKELLRYTDTVIPELSPVLRQCECATAQEISTENLVTSIRCYLDEKREILEPQCLEDVEEVLTQLLDAPGVEKQRVLIAKLIHVWSTQYNFEKMLTIAVETRNSLLFSRISCTVNLLRRWCDYLSLGSVTRVNEEILYRCCPEASSITL